MPRLFPLLLTGLCLLLQPAPAQPVPEVPMPEKTLPEGGAPLPSWQIRLDRPATPGQRYTLSATGSQDKQTKINSPTQLPEISEEHLEITYAAIHEIKAVDEKGHPAEILLRVDRLTTNDGSGPCEQFPAGTLITATANGDRTRYQLGREELDGTVADALNLAGAKLPSTREPSEDDVFLNHSPRQPGDRWSADPQRLADAIAATTTFTVDPVTSSAEIHFDRTLTENGIPALATTTTYNIAPTALRDSPDQNLTKSSLTSTTSRIHPVDPSLPMLKEELKTDMKMILRAKSGPQPAGSEVTFQRHVTRRYHPLTNEGKQKE